MTELPMWWYLVRASGLVAWLGMGVSVLFGVVLSTKLFPERRRPVWLLDVHRWVSGLGVVALLTHLGALVADSYLEFGIRELLVPFTSAWKPVAVAAGVVSTWLLIVTTVVAMARRRLPRPVWRGIHRLGYLSFWFASLHGAWAGTDAANPVVRVVGATVLSSVVFGLVYRLLVTENPKRRPGAVVPRLDEVRAAARERSADHPARDVG